MTQQTIHEIRAWDNDMPVFSEWYDIENNTFYVNNMAIPNGQPHLEGTTTIKHTNKRTHCDDVPALLRRVLKPGYTVIKF